jgi:hypothetical protein
MILYGKYISFNLLAVYRSYRIVLYYFSPTFVMHSRREILVLKYISANSQYLSIYSQYACVCTSALRISLKNAKGILISVRTTKWKIGFLRILLLFLHGKTAESQPLKRSTLDLLLSGNSFCFCWRDSTHSSSLDPLKSLN